MTLDKVYDEFMELMQGDPTDSEIKKICRLVNLELLDYNKPFKINRWRLRKIRRANRKVINSNIGHLCGSSVLYIYNIIDRMPNNDIDIILDKKDHGVTINVSDSITETFLSKKVTTIDSNNKDTNFYKFASKNLDNFTLDTYKSMDSEDERGEENILGMFRIKNTRVDIFKIKDINSITYNDLKLQHPIDVISYKIQYLKKAKRRKDYKDLKNILEYLKK